MITLGNVIITRVETEIIKLSDKFTLEVGNKIWWVWNEVLQNFIYDRTCFIF